MFSIPVSTLRHLLKKNTYSLCVRGVSTIYALSSAQGKCGVSVIRISGPSSKLALTKLCPSKLPKPRVATLRTLIHPLTMEVLDQALVLWFPEPRSFTGENCVEFHVHGSLAVVRAVLNALAVLPDFRQAQPGEFTKRAFYAQKLDLTQVEAIGDLIHAETEMQRKQAVRQMSGDISRAYTKWRNDLIRLTANVEAVIDFAESDDLEDGVLENVFVEAKTLLDELEGHAKDARAGERLRHGVQVAIVGEPNVGKSSFLNLLAQRPAAIVSHLPGTTRDILETTLDIGGYPIILMDTAGVRAKGSDEVEEEGIRRAKEKAMTADLLIIIIDAVTLLEDLKKDTFETVLFNSLSHLDLSPQTQQNVLILINKTDLVNLDSLLGQVPRSVRWEHGGQDVRTAFLSCKTTDRFSNVLDELKSELGQLCSSGEHRENPLLTRDRHVGHVKNACENLKDFLAAEECADLAVACHHLRKALREIGFITGSVSADQLLDVIFADFCIGK